MLSVNATIIIWKETDTIRFGIYACSPEDTVTRADGIHAFHEIRKQLEGVPDMSLEEINNEIAEIRAERKAKNI